MERMGRPPDCGDYPVLDFYFCTCAHVRGTKIVLSATADDGRWQVSPSHRHRTAFRLCRGVRIHGVAGARTLSPSFFFGSSMEVAGRRSEEHTSELQSRQYLV